MNDIQCLIEKKKAEREAREKAEREAREKAEREAREKAKREARENAERASREMAESAARIACWNTRPTLVASTRSSSPQNTWGTGSPANGYRCSCSPAGSCGGWSGGGWSGGGCFSGDGQVAVGEHGERTVRVEDVRVGHAVYSPVLKRAVKVVATTHSIERDQVCIIRGLRLTHKHPIQVDGNAWSFPKDVALASTLKLERPITVHNFVLAEGGAALINGMVVITLGDNAAAGLEASHPCAHPLYGTERVVERLSAQPSWPQCKW